MADGTLENAEISASAVINSENITAEAMPNINWLESFGTNNYDQLENKPSINEILLIGKQTTESLGIKKDVLLYIGIMLNDYYNQTQIDEMLKANLIFSRKIVEELPTEKKENIIYMLAESSEEDTANNRKKYLQYIWSKITGDWQEIGSIYVDSEKDLSFYYSKNEIDDLLGNKVDKENGKGLSQENFTTEQKTKLEATASKDDLTKIEEEIADKEIEILNKIYPTKLNVTYPKKITIGNKVAQYIVCTFEPANNYGNVIFLGDNKAVTVAPNGYIQIKQIGTSTIHIVPTNNTQLYQTIQIEVVEKGLLMISSNKLFIANKKLIFK